MTLRQWLDNKWLLKHQTSSGEIRYLLEIINRDIADSGNRDLSPDWRLAIAYNAILQCAISALAASGYRTNKGGSHHYYAIESLSLTIGLSRDDILVINALRKKRHIADYERAGTISAKEADEILVITEDTKLVLMKWLESEHPSLLS